MSIVLVKHWMLRCEPCGWQRERMTGHHVGSWDMKNSAIRQHAEECPNCPVGSVGVDVEDVTKY